MSDTLKVVLAVVGLYIALPVLVLIGVDRLRARFRRLPTNTMEAMWGGVERERLLHPDWAFYESHLQRPVPSKLCELYANPQLVLAKTLLVGEEKINGFQPLAAEGLVDCHDFIGTDLVPLAYNICGDPIYLRPGMNEPDKIYLTYHDNNVTEVLSESVDQFIAQLRAVL